MAKELTAVNQINPRWWAMRSAEIWNNAIAKNIQNLRKAVRNFVVSTNYLLVSLKNTFVSFDGKY